MRKSNTKVSEFEKTGLAFCVHHGLHSEWKILTRSKSRKGKEYPYTVVECKMCVRDRTRRWNREHPKYQNEYRYSKIGVINRVLAQARKRAKEHKLGFELDFDWIVECLAKQNNKCKYSGIEFDFSSPRYKSAQRYNLPSVDRFNPDQGYTKENSFLVCWSINLMKNSIPFNLFISYCQAVAKYNQDIL